MSDQTQSVDNLQEALSMEMAAVQQYLVHAHVLDDWGIDVLARQMRQEMTEELGHAGRFIDRILFLGGDPKVKPAKAPKRADTLEDMFRADLEDEMSAIAFYSTAARAASDDMDVGTRMLFEALVLDEEGHQDWLTRQLALLERMGEPTFVAQNMSDTARSG